MTQYISIFILKKQDVALSEAFRKVDALIDWEAFIKYADAPVVADSRSAAEFSADQEIQRVYSKNRMQGIIAWQRLHDSQIRCMREASMNSLSNISDTWLIKYVPLILFVFQIMFLRCP